MEKQTPEQVLELQTGQGKNPPICFVSFLSLPISDKASKLQVVSVKTGLKPTWQIAIETQLFVPITIEMLLFGNKSTAWEWKDLHRFNPLCAHSLHALGETFSKV